MRKIWLATAIALMGIVAWAQPRGLDVRTDWLYQEPFLNEMLSTPVRIELTNSGPALEGTVYLSSSYDYDSPATRTVVPINLPTGSKKEVVIYPQDQWGRPDQIVVETSRGNFKIELPSSLNRISTSPVLIVTDSPGEYGFLTLITVGERPRFAPAYVAVERAPVRMRAYQTVTYLVLGEGTERMTDGAVEAIKQHVLGGGTLIFAASAGGNAVDDPRWADLAPIRNRRPERLAQPGTLTYSGTAVGSPVTNWVGDPVPEARTSAKVVARRSYGMGAVVYLGVDLLTPPLDAWPGRGEFFSKAIRINSAEIAKERLRSFTGSDDQYEDSSHYLSHSHMNDERAVPMGGAFKFDLPNSDVVWVILIVYGVLVGPVNFLLLRRMKRTELAWITAPILSVVFAGIFLIHALPLYRTPLTSRITGTIVEQVGVPGAAFAGTADLFFPIGGTYSLKLKNTEYIRTGSDYYESTSPIDAIVDQGSLDVPRFRVSNLAFESLGLIELLPKTSLLDGEAVPDPKGTRVTVKNVSPYILESVRVERNATIRAELKPNETFTEIVAAKPADKIRVLITGKVKGVRPGPQLGKPDTEGSRVDFRSYVSVRTAAQ